MSDDLLTMRAVGVVHAPWKTPPEVPIEGGQASIEIDPRYADALDDIERSSHIIVFGFLHLADRTVLRARPRRLDPTAPPCGVFASRSPARPNPISLSVVRLVGREGRFLTVDPLDLADQTPVVDLKSYNPGWDGVFSARRVRRLRHAALDDATLRAFLEREVRNHLGDDADAPGARFAIDAMLRAVRTLDVDARDERLTLTVTTTDAATDAIMAMTGTTFAGGRLRLRPEVGPAKITFALGDRLLEVAAPGAPP